MAFSSSKDSCPILRVEIWIDGTSRIGEFLQCFLVDFDAETRFSRRTQHPVSDIIGVKDWFGDNRVPEWLIRRRIDFELMDVSARKGKVQISSDTHRCQPSNMGDAFDAVCLGVGTDFLRLRDASCDCSVRPPNVADAVVVEVLELVK